MLRSSKVLSVFAAFFVLAGTSASSLASTESDLMLLQAVQAANSSEASAALNQGADPNVRDEQSGVPAVLYLMRYFGYGSAERNVLSPVYAPAFEVLQLLVSAQVNLNVLSSYDG